MAARASAWPLHGIRLVGDGVRLRVLTEADLDEVVGALPDDVELNPSATPYAGLDERGNRGAAVAQAYWRALGTWSPDDWALPFVAHHDGALVGVQWLEGPDYRVERTVDSSSWLVSEARGRGLGTAMRAAVLTLAFGPLAAVAAVSSAVADNAASLGVSRRLGYRDTHTSVLPHSGAPLQHVRLTRDAWLASGQAGRTRVEGVDAALPLFGRSAP
ncbi:GNAT family N-acetyltransferase [Terracoccus luteus]|uniref:RimJ/RimL family protein N-acetyltransferase n=1 Tax=Terracoccus luteus TaxID=53356 RepID=A0A839PLY0_9MICO|nr:GNAT family N-acetyltransferase [Terracoccus luteus]MBB2985308.1 RimJ/RimL family protein N-acetyltransferase [Terracoccus luteus]MCP2170960.1 RimJ/RimL family protein N-acetyltransferase [Terracoccus luteus]